jgi:hypothetical protein
MKGLEIKTVRFKLFAIISERMAQENLRSRIFIHYMGNDLNGDISVSFGNTCGIAHKIRFLQILDEEYHKVYMQDLERESN